MNANAYLHPRHMAGDRIHERLLEVHEHGGWCPMGEDVEVPQHVKEFVVCVAILKS